jgi:hypothetical protein
MTQEPTQNEVITLIDRAKSHDLGIDFLSNGALDAVAMTFGVHAFVVDAARDELSKPTITVELRETATV